MITTFGDSYGNNVKGPLEWTGHGAVIATRPAWLRVSPAR
jgi:hypothetical protein